MGSIGPPLDSNGNTGHCYEFIIFVLAELPSQQHVAVKKFIPPKLEPGKFLEEAEMMKKFNHPHLVSLVGICAKELPIFIVTELMALGSLLEFLRHDAGVSLLTHTLLDYAAQV